MLEFRTEAVRDFLDAVHVAFPASAKTGILESHTDSLRQQPFRKTDGWQGSSVFTDEYSIYARLPGLGYSHKTVCHGRGEYARDEDGDGFCEVHVNTMEGFWSLLRSWLRPHRGISQEKLPIHLGFFQFVHNVRRRGKALLGSLIEALVT